MKVQMSLQQTQMDRSAEIPYLVSVEDVFQLAGVSMVKCAMVAYNTSMMADSMDVGGHLYTYNEGITSYLYCYVVIQNGRVG
ncbi:hypothetical protein Hanom_Chr06g00578161 [Helianthus anomalus]